MGITEAAPMSDHSDSNNEKGEIQFVEHTVAVSPLTGRLEDGKLTKETVLAYIVRCNGQPLVVEH
jgi:hypothetical protein